MNSVGNEVREPVKVPFRPETKRVRVVIITEIIAPYRIPVFNAAAERDDLDLHVIFLAENDPQLRQWQVYKKEIRFSFEVLPNLRLRFGQSNLLLNRGIDATLSRARGQVIVCGGYNYPASWQAASWARTHAVPFLLWSESTASDARKGNWLVEYAKQRFIRRADAFLVPGRSARKYLEQQGVDERRIFTAPNAVDVEFFSERSTEARRNADHIRQRWNLPGRYFLYVGRLVREKGIFELLESYARLANDVRSEVGLVFAGDGNARQALEQRAASVQGQVRFVGFLQRDDLPGIYALADAIALPTHSDTWGLVVNEAMSCGLPVLLSDLAGCAGDLVESGTNGYLIPACDVEKWAEALSRIATNPELRASMGANSLAKIQHFRPVDWAGGLAAVASTLENR